MMSFQNRFIECCLVKLLRHVCISGQWRCFMAECGVYSSVCMNNAHILFFFTSCSLFIYQLRRPAALRVYKQPLSHPPPGTCVLWRCRIKKTSIRNSAHIQAWRVVSLKETTEQSHSIPGRPLAPRKTIFDVLLSSFDWFTAHHEQRHPLWWALLKYSPAQRFMHI